MCHVWRWGDILQEPILSSHESQVKRSGLMVRAFAFGVILPVPKSLSYAKRGSEACSRREIRRTSKHKQVGLGANLSGLRSREANS